MRLAASALLGMYSGDVVEYQLGDSSSPLHVIAVNNCEFRSDRGNWPKIIHWGQVTTRSVVLVHGLTDSPFWLEAIGQRLALRDGGANVVLPLLSGHGRRNPGAAMAAATLQDWRQVVDDAVAIACELGGEVSIGGFSTGGALAVDKVVRTSKLITGKVLLFSAALDLSDLNKLFIGTHVAEWIEAIKEGKTENNGLGGDPCKYSRMFMSGAKQLEILVKQLRSSVISSDGWAHKDRTFVAHSEADEVIAVEAVLPLMNASDPRQHHIILKTCGVSHSSLVLDKNRVYMPVYADERTPPPANPEFVQMMRKASAFFVRT